MQHIEPRVLGDISGAPSSPPSVAKTWRGRLLLCGVAAPLVYAAADVLGGALRPLDGAAPQSWRGLLAMGSASRVPVLPAFLLYSALLLAFAIGVWRVADDKRALRIIGWLLGSVAVLSAWAAPFVSVVPGSNGGPSGPVQGALASVVSLLPLVAIALGTTALRSPFGYYSVATLLVIAVLGTLAEGDGVRLAAALPGTGLGLHERAAIFAYLLWVAVLALVLFRTRGRHPAAGRIRTHPVAGSPER